jgi:hypothetical protein
MIKIEFQKNKKIKCLVSQIILYFCGVIKLWIYMYFQTNTLDYHVNLK